MLLKQDMHINENSFDEALRVMIYFYGHALI